MAQRSDTPTQRFTDVIDSPTEFSESWLGRLHNRRVVEGDNDLVVAVAAASKSAVSGVGKTTLAIRLARELDTTDGGFNAESKATLNADEFVNNILRSKEGAPDGSAVVFDELQGTLSSQGADGRRSMADVVMRVSKAIATLRYRQLSAVLVSQSLSWVDSRIRQLLDALVLIQRPGHAIVFDVYENDLQEGKRYTERKQTLTWEPLPKTDPDYAHLHELKAQSAFGDGVGSTGDNSEEGDQQDGTTDRDTRIQNLVDEGVPQSVVAEAFDVTQQRVSQIVN